MLYEVTGLEIQLCNNFTYRSQPTQLKIVEPSLEHSRGSTEFPNLRGFLSYGWTSKSTDKQRLLLYVDIKISYRSLEPCKLYYKKSEFAKIRDKLNGELILKIKIPTVDIEFKRLGLRASNTILPSSERINSISSAVYKTAD